MSETDISKAKNKDLAASTIAMHRTAAMARHLSVQTDTDIIFFEDGKIIRVTAKTFRALDPSLA